MTGERPDPWGVDALRDMRARALAEQDPPTRLRLLASALACAAQVERAIRADRDAHLRVMRDRGATAAHLAVLAGVSDSYVTRVTRWSPPRRPRHGDTSRDTVT